MDTQHHVVSVVSTKPFVTDGTATRKAWTSAELKKKAGRVGLSAYALFAYADALLACVDQHASARPGLHTLWL